ncbi:hypothetical protein NIES4102_11140 [Chondrocystis sp. NIES-4102]|nr:hypothetical protein NIES4102_11140 [Chondrocystis sp. NIES-4102]
MIVSLLQVYNAPFEWAIFCDAMLLDRKLIDHFQHLKTRQPSYK